MSELFALGFTPVDILIILIVAIPLIIKFIGWCKNLWKIREQFKQESIEQGRKIEAHAEEKENRFTAGETRMTTLENNVLKLTEIAKKQQLQIDLLIRSDELDIKSWIKAQHEKWIPLKCIDSQTLDLLEQRYAIYEEEGGNSWAKKLVEELRALPVVTVIPIPESHDKE